MDKTAFRLILFALSAVLLASAAYGANCGGDDQCSCGDTITSSWTMGTNLTNSTGGDVCESSPALTMNGNNILLDCNGSYMKGGVNTGYILYDFTGYRNVTIKNCNIRCGEFPNCRALEFKYHKNLTIFNNHFFGDEFSELGIMVTNSKNVTIYNNIVENFGTWAGIDIEDNVGNLNVFNNTLMNNSAGIYLNQGINNASVYDNTITGSRGWCGIYVLSGSNENKFYRNSLQGNDCSLAGGPANSQVYLDPDCLDNEFNLSNIGNYWGSTVYPYFNCSRDSNTCSIKNDTKAFGQNKGWLLSSSFLGTDFSNLPAETGGNYSRLENVSLKKGNNTINFTSPIDFDNGVNLDDYISFGTGFVSINTSGLLAAGNDFNKTANVTLAVEGCYNLQIKYAPDYYTNLNDMMLNGQNCNETTTPSCSDILCIGTNVSFNVEHFDGYVGEGEIPPIPEFSTITLMLALVVVIGGFFMMRRNN